MIKKITKDAYYDVMSVKGGLRKVFKVANYQISDDGFDEETTITKHFLIDYDVENYYEMDLATAYDIVAMAAMNLDEQLIISELKGYIEKAN